MQIWLPALHIQHGIEQIYGIGKRACVRNAVKAAQARSSVSCKSKNIKDILNPELHYNGHRKKLFGSSYAPFPLHVVVCEKRADDGLELIHRSGILPYAGHLDEVADGVPTGSIPDVVFGVLQRVSVAVKSRADPQLLLAGAAVGKGLPDVDGASRPQAPALDFGPCGVESPIL